MNVSSVIFHDQNMVAFQKNLREAPQAFSLHSSPSNIPLRPSFANSSDSHNFLAGSSCKKGQQGNHFLQSIFIQTTGKKQVNIH